MVSENPFEPNANAATSTATRRVFIPEETVVGPGPGTSATLYYKPFWRPVLAGTLFTFSLFVLSWYLMLGLHIGLNDDGTLGLGGGAAVWLCLTACVAYFVGGMIASVMTAGDMQMSSIISGLLKGAVLWGLSIPLGLVIYGFVYDIVARADNLVIALNMPHAGALANNVQGTHLGYYWSVFIGLGLGLFFSLIGGVGGLMVRRDNFERTLRTSE